MKFLLNSFLLCMIVMQFIACKKEATNPSNGLPVTAASVAGNFTVGSFVGNGSQSTSLDGFSFTFKENGTIIATNGNDSFNGTWKFDDGNNTEIKIAFTNAPLDQLNKSWHIKDLTDDHLYLTDDSQNENEEHDDDYSSGNSSLEFERN